MKISLPEGIAASNQIISQQKKYQVNIYYQFCHFKLQPSTFSINIYYMISLQFRNNYFPIHFSNKKINFGYKMPFSVPFPSKKLCPLKILGSKLECNLRDLNKWKCEITYDILKIETRKCKNILRTPHKRY